MPDNIEELKKKIDDIPIKKVHVSAYGNCSRCGDFDELTKGIWNDPYTGQDGFGRLCKKCLKETQPVQVKYNYKVEGASTPNLAGEFNPVPKPEKKSKNKKT